MEAVESLNLTDAFARLVAWTIGLMATSIFASEVMSSSGANSQVIMAHVSGLPHGSHRVGELNRGRLTTPEP
jgi:hypothetical protein